MPNPLFWNPNFVQTRRVETFITPGETGGSDNVDGGKPRRCLPRVLRRTAVIQIAHLHVLPENIF